MAPQTREPPLDRPPPPAYEASPLVWIVPPEPPTAADFYVHSLPGMPPSSRLQLYSGLLPSSEVSSPPSAADSDAHLYFLLTSNRHIPARPRLIVWFQGGPACSSFDGSMLEVGPLRVSKGKLREVENSWDQYANVLFLDQPAGTGFSYVTKHDDVRELAEAAEQVVIFLSNFYAVFPELASMDLYLAGESYAGQWIPYVADAILRTTRISPRLSGLMIGNGWFDPRNQYPGYVDYLVKEKIVKSGSSAHKEIVAATDKCTAAISKMDVQGDGTDAGMVLIPVCEEILSTITAATMMDGLCLNAYDTRKYQTCGAEWPPELAEVTPYLQREDVVKALHADTTPVPRVWTQCSNVVGAHFWTPKSRPSVGLLSSLLEKVPILLYVGDRDLMCAYTGLETMISKLEWNGGVGMSNGTVTEDWHVDEKLVGSWTTSRNLTYVKIFNSSHMVPLDFPLAAQDMVLRFMAVDTLHAAGSAAKIPSRIGDEIPAVLGATAVNGTTLPGVVEAAKAAQVAEQMPVVDEDGLNREHEAYYGPRRSASLFIVLIGAGILVWALNRWLKGRRGVQYGKMGKRSRRRGRSKGIRLDENNAGQAAERRQREAAADRAEEEHLDSPIFDLGDEEDAEEDDGDLGSTKHNPWMEDRN